MGSALRLGGPGRVAQSDPVDLCYENRQHESRRIQLKFPFDPLSVVFEGDKITAPAECHLVDVWEEVQIDILI